MKPPTALDNVKRKCQSQHSKDRVGPVVCKAPTRSGPMDYRHMHTILSSEIMRITINVVYTKTLQFWRIVQLCLHTRQGLAHSNSMVWLEICYTCIVFLFRQRSMPWNRALRVSWWSRPLPISNNSSPTCRWVTGWVLSSCVQPNSQCPWLHVLISQQQPLVLNRPISNLN